MPDLSAYSKEQRERIAKTARRNVWSECVLILTAGFALTMLTLFFAGSRILLPLSLLLEMRPLILWAILSTMFSVGVAWWHYRRSSPKVEQAQALNAEFLYEYQNELSRSRSGEEASSLKN